MAVNLVKGQKVNLVKASGGSGLRAIGLDGGDDYEISVNGYVNGVVCLPDGRALSVRAGNHSFSSRQSPAFEEMK